jgi:hypothetical protein
MTDLMNEPRGDWVAATNSRTSKKGKWSENQNYFINRSEHQNLFYKLVISTSKIHNIEIMLSLYRSLRVK